MDILVFILWTMIAAWMLEMSHAKKQTEEKIMAKLSELAGILNGIKTKVDAIDAAVVASASADPDLSPETQAAVDALSASVDKAASDAKV